MGQYITADELKIRCAGKVKFATDDTDSNAVGPTFLADIIAEAEALVEMRLSIRYAVPFVGTAGAAFSALSVHTRALIKGLIFSEAIRRLIDYDFGRGSAVEGGKYAEQQMRVFEAQMGRLVAYREGQFGQFLYPPLVDLALAPHNDQADDGYAGQIYVTSDGPGEYAAAQMPSPGETLWNGEIREL